VGLRAILVGRFGEKSLAPAVIRTPDRPAHNLSSIPTTVSRLLQRGTSLTCVVDIAL
jgi:hypothetical protein